MTQDRIQNLLRDADTAAPHPQVAVPDIAAAVRHRARRRRRRHSLVVLAAAAVVIVAIGIWPVLTQTPESPADQDKVALLEAEIKQLRARTDALTGLVHEILRQEREQRRLDEIRAEVASVSDPLEKVEEEVDRTAFLLVYQADRMCRQLHQTASAVHSYQRVIELFPRSRWAEIARQRLVEINESENNIPDSEGDLLWKPQKPHSSC